MAALKSTKEEGQAWRRAERVGVLIEDTTGEVLKGCAAIVTTFTFPTSDMSDVGYVRRRICPTSDMPDVGKGLVVRFFLALRPGTQDLWKIGIRQDEQREARKSGQAPKWETGYAGPRVGNW